MAYSKIQNVEIKGIAACVPDRVEKNRDFPLLNQDQIEKYIDQVGVVERHCAIHDGSLCTSDLCYEAAEKLLNELGWKREEIGLLVFVSHCTDYKLPATACVLQDRLGLSKETMAFDVPLGCSGWVYGLGIASNIISNGFVKKALLLCGNTQSMYASPLDKSTALLFGDGGSATALEYNPGAEAMHFHHYTDGSGFEALIVPDGGARHPFNEHSAEMEEFEEGIKRSRLHEQMDGMSVFSFAISAVPKSLKGLMEQSGLTTDKINYLLLHQANKFICEKIRKKMKFEASQTPYNIDCFGNTSATSLPLLMVTELRNELQKGTNINLGCGFGVGLSIGSVLFKTDKIIVPELIIKHQDVAD